MNNFNQKSLILLVDDIPVNIELLEEILKDEGYSILATSNGRETFETLGKCTPDLILLDVMLPDIDGFEICERLKKNPATSQIPVIFITAANNLENKIRGFDLGAVDYITKPFKDVEVIARVRTHIQLKKAKDKQDQLIGQLQDALKQVKQLSGLLPICSHCHKIRNDKGYWQRVDAYISSHSDAQFSHSICPPCLRQHYPEIAEQTLKKLDSSKIHENKGR